MFKKNIIYLGLNQKNTKKLQASLNKFIKVINFIIYFY